MNPALSPTDCPVTGVLNDRSHGIGGYTGGKLFSVRKQGRLPMTGDGLDGDRLRVYIAAVTQYVR